MYQTIATYLFRLGTTLSFLRVNRIPFTLDQMKRILDIVFASGAFPHYRSFQYQDVSFLPNVDFVFAILIVGRCTIRVGHD